MPKRNRPSGSYEPPTIQNLLQCVAFHDDERDRADIHRDSALAALRPLADKHALRLRKLQPAEVAAYLADFNLVVAALGLDAQEELFPRGAVSVTVQSVN
jgi:hypothetical protein